MGSVSGQRIALDVRSVSKRYSSSVVVGPITFAVKEGEFFSLLGPSGCGKSTTLRCIAGFEPITSGEIHLGGQRLDTIPAHRRELGLVFQSHALFPHLSVEGNIAFGLNLRRISQVEIRQRVGWALDLVGLSGLEKRMPSQISGGQQQRVALARSLVLKPPLLLLDEPLSSLDLKLRQQMREELRRLQRQLGQTTVFVTHDQTEALALSDRIAVLSNGKIEQIGSPQEIYRRPASRFVADFIGQSNLIEAKVGRRRDGLVDLHVNGGMNNVLQARTSEPSTLSEGATVFAVVRPEDVLLTAANGRAPEGNILPGRVTDVEYLGEDTHVRITVPGLPVMLASFKTTRAASAYTAGADVAIEIDATDVFIVSR